MEHQPIQVGSEASESTEDYCGAEASAHHFRFRRIWMGAMTCLTMSSIIMVGGWILMQQRTDKSDLDNVVQSSSTLSQRDIIKKSNKVAEKEWNWVLIKLNSAK